MDIFEHVSKIIPFATHPHNIAITAVQLCHFSNLFNLGCNKKRIKIYKMFSLFAVAQVSRITQIFYEYNNLAAQLLSYNGVCGRAPSIPSTKVSNKPWQNQGFSTKIHWFFLTESVHSFYYCSQDVFKQIKFGKSFRSFA